MTLYEYRARPVRAIDGDTIEVVVDLGFGLTMGAGSWPFRIRVLGVNCPEMHSKDEALRAKAVEAKAFTAKWLADAAARTDEWPIRIATEKGDSFGRWLATVTNGKSSLGVDLLDARLAVPFDGEHHVPFPVATAEPSEAE
jgi:micrococcal nuclease